MAQIVTTYLEMNLPTELRPRHCPDARFRILEATVKQWRANRFLYQAVGCDWDWIDKRNWTDEQWREYAESEKVRTFLAWYDGSPAGYFELREDEGGGMEIVYLGLLPVFIGKGFGAALVTRALEEAWASKPKRVWLHTCNLDHPCAIANYQARGMKIYKTETKQG